MRIVVFTAISPFYSFCFLYINFYQKVIREHKHPTGVVYIMNLDVYEKHAPSTVLQKKSPYCIILFFSDYYHYLLSNHLREVISPQSSYKKRR